MIEEIHNNIETKQFKAVVKVSFNIELLVDAEDEDDAYVAAREELIHCSLYTSCDVTVTSDFAEVDIRSVEEQD
jgi:hypothetical protein